MVKELNHESGSCCNTGQSFAAGFDEREQPIPSPEVKSALYYSLKASNIFKTFEFERSAKTNGILGQYRESTPFPDLRSSGVNCIVPQKRLLKIFFKRDSFVDARFCCGLPIEELHLI